MSTKQSPVLECPYRQPHADGIGVESAICGLLHDMTGVEDASLCQVREDACRSCLQWFRPSKADINPVFASLLYTLTSDIINQSGVPGCSVEAAEQLNQRAIRNIPHDEDFASTDESAGSVVDVDEVRLESIVPRPWRRSGRRVQEWAVGVTTAPRNPSTLGMCLDSLHAAGWPEARLFIDGNVEVPNSELRMSITRRDPQIGAWPSYYLALGELMMRSPGADAYMLVQDDVVLFQHASLREYLERVLWPGRRPGIVSLFCSRAYRQEKPGWHKLKQSLVWGGQLLIFSHDAAQRILSDEHVVAHRLQPGKAGLANIDGLIGEWAARTNTPVYLPTPSLAQHVGQVSTLWPRTRAYGNRRADWFAGDVGAGGRECIKPNSDRS